MKKHIFTIIILVSVILTLVTSAKCYHVALLPYENGRYFDPINETVHHEQALIGYGYVTFCLWILTTGLIYWRTKI